MNAKQDANCLATARFFCSDVKPRVISLQLSFTEYLNYKALFVSKILNIRPAQRLCACACARAWERGFVYGRPHVSEPTRNVLVGIKVAVAVATKKLRRRHADLGKSNLLSSRSCCFTNLKIPNEVWWFPESFNAVLKQTKLKFTQFTTR